MRISFDWLKSYVDIRIAPQVLAEKLTMAGLEVTSLTRIDQDTVMEIEVTPNRTDCLSIIGIAREVSAITGNKLKLPKISAFRGKSAAALSIQVQAKALCPRYLGRVIKNVKVGPSPEWLVQRLEVMGIRAVNNIVDTTNFCLLEFGQPLHAFDLDKLQGEKIIVRHALGSEQIVTIDGVQRNLDPTMLVIADKFNPQALAGIMGAAASEVSQETTNILLESAYFDPLNIHNTSRKLGLATQSSYRFERGVDWETVLFASLRATELIEKLARPDHKGSRVGTTQRVGRKKPKKMLIGKLIDKGKKAVRLNRMTLRVARVSEVLGLAVPAPRIKEILRRLKFLIVRSSKQSIVVRIPSFRPDVSREADLIEEVVRLYGYDKIPLRLAQLTPNLSSLGNLKPDSEEIYDAVRRILSSCELNEIMSYSLISRQALRRLELSLGNTITIKNPLSYEQEILRPTLLVGMLNALLTNINRKNTNLKLFELSRIYYRAGANTIKESSNLCIGISGKKSDNWLQKSSEYSFFDLKGIVETLLRNLGAENFRFLEGAFPYFTSGRCAELFLGEDSCGFLGEIKKEILERYGLTSSVHACELRLPGLMAHLRREKRFVPLARFPAIERDISLVAPFEVHSEQMVSLIKKIGRDLIVRVKLFDQYFGEQIPQGFRGLAYSIEYRSQEKTLTAEEVNKLHGQIRQALSEELKVQVR